MAVNQVLPHGNDVAAWQATIIYEWRVKNNVLCENADKWKKGFDISSELKVFGDLTTEEKYSFRTRK